ncbi:pentapeptide repeat-containing protein [Geodermatophilus sp. URMC 62]|uniref:pentapeptide repeat-containing protein n=1 Tax=Geodermatophilus sp. URMC 62 TaxID=3423414 RepID=UPI00406C2C1D
MSTWLIAAGLVLALVVAGALLALVPERPEGVQDPYHHWRPLPPWHQRVRQRLQRRHQLVLSYLGVIAVAVLVLVVWVLPSLLTRHPLLIDAAERHQAITGTRTGLVALLAAIGAAGGLAYTARTYRLSREGHITDRYSKAVDQLASEKIEARLGGIYALERLMRDSPADQPTIMETLAAFVRVHAPRTSPDTPTDGTSPSVPDHPAGDVQAVLTVLGRRHTIWGEPPIDLRGTKLTGFSLYKASLNDANLQGADLTNVYLIGADLTGAWLAGANLIGADLRGANLIKADLSWANLTGADLDGADLRGTILFRATMTRGSLSEEQWAYSVYNDEIEWVEGQPRPVVPDRPVYGLPRPRPLPPFNPPQT